MKELLQPIKEDMSGLKTDITELKVDVGGLKSQVSENTEILKALEHKTDVLKAEQEKLNNEMAHIQGDIMALRKDISNVEIITSSNWNDIAKLKAAK